MIDMLLTATQSLQRAHIQRSTTWLHKYCVELKQDCERREKTEKQPSCSEIFFFLSRMLNPSAKLMGVRENIDVTSFLYFLI